MSTHPGATPRAFCAIATRSHLPGALALADSLRTAGNTEPLHVLVADAEAPADLPPPTPGIVFHATGGLAVQPPAGMRHYFDAFEYSNALKPFFVTHLLAGGCDQVIYLDSDIYVTGSFSAVWEALESTSLLLTPHHLSPPPRLPHTDEVAIVDQGMLNGGFAGWRAGPGAERILAWMRDSFPQHGFCDRAAGMFVDQKLLPLALLYFPAEVTVSRDPTLNVAFWNVHERPVAASPAGRRSISGRAVVFFHLSGYRLDRPEDPCSYLPASTNAAILEGRAWLREVMDEYRALLGRHGAAKPEAPAYRYARWNGIVLNPAYRRILFRGGRLDWGNPEFRRAWAVHRLKLIKRAILRWLK